MENEPEEQDDEGDDEGRNGDVVRKVPIEEMLLACVLRGQDMTDAPWYWQ